MAAPTMREDVDLDFLRNVLPPSFEPYLRGIDFPIGKHELLRRLKENGAPSVVVDKVRVSVSRRGTTEVLRIS
jgi:hypothetical protein